MRRHTSAARLAACLVSLVLLGGCATSTASSPAPTTAPVTSAEVSPAPTTSPSIGGTVSVTLVGLTGASGSQVIAFLVPGWPPASAIQHADVSGFVVNVDADPFTRTELLRPYVKIDSDRMLPVFGKSVAPVPRGTHTLNLYMGTDLKPYTEYFWSGTDETDDVLEARSCSIEVPVADGLHTEVRVTGVPNLAEGPEKYEKSPLPGLLLTLCPTEARPGPSPT